MKLYELKEIIQQLEQAGCDDTSEVMIESVDDETSFEIVAFEHAREPKQSLIIYCVA